MGGDTDGSGFVPKSKPPKRKKWNSSLLDMGLAFYQGARIYPNVSKC
jgi:hypothetical protein